MAESRFQELYDMCRKAEEIQDARRSFMLGDAIYNTETGITGIVSLIDSNEGGVEYCISCYDKGYGEIDADWFVASDDRLVWIPRFDQLSSFVRDWNRNYSHSFFEYITVSSKFKGLPEKGFDSIEKHLLAFVMSERYGKKWNGDTKEWIEIKSGNES